MKLKLNRFLVLVFALISQLVLSQEKNATGVVIDNNGSPIPGVNIQIKGTVKGTSTNFDGSFKIKADANEILVFTYIGMNTVERSASMGMKVKLTDEANKLADVAIVAFGKQSKRTITGSTVQIKAEQFNQRSVTNITQALVGAAPGIQVSAGSGEPGSGSNVRLRGFSSLNFSNAPLYIVDGVPLLSNTLNGSGVGIEGSALAGLNNSDIESVTVLKDAASTALYGSSAANGVILITTKKGKVGKTTVNVNFSTGLSTRSIPQYDRVDAKDYYLLNWESIKNGRISSGDSPFVASTFANNNLITVLKSNVYDVPDTQLVVNGVFNPNAKLKYNDLDWDSEIAKTGTRQNADLSFSGATEKTSYFASVSYLKDNGYVIKSDFERLNGRLNVDSQLKDWLKVGLNTSISNIFANNAIDANDNATSFVNPFFITRGMGPIYSPFLHNADGTNVYDANGNKVFDLFQDRGANAAAGRHAIYENLNNVNLRKTFSTSNRLVIDVKLFPSLTFTSINGYDTRNFLNREYGNSVIGDGATAGTAGRTVNLNQTINNQQLLNFKKTINSHSFEALAGHESLSTMLEYLTTSKKLETIAGNDELANFATTTSSNSYTNNYRKEGVFARVNYDYKQKYILTGSVRRDGSSKFGSDYRWDNFYAAGARWNISDEKMFQNSKFINQLSLKGSYGVVGNDNGISNFASQSTYDLGVNNGTEPGIIINRVADPALRWEGNTQADLGIDFALLNSRFSGSVEVYKRTSTNLLFSVPSSLSSGNTSITRNIGAMENKGIEISLKLSPVKNPNFGIDVVLNATRNLNTVTKLPDGQPEIISGTKKYMEGHSIYDFWLRQWYGVDPTDGAGLFLLDDKLVGTTATDIRIIDGKSLTTSSNKAKFDYSGTANPNWYGSAGLNVKLKQLTLSTLFSYQVGGKVYDTNYLRIMSGYPQGLALNTDILNRWQNPGDITDVPALNSTNTTNIAAGSTRWLRSSDYLVFRTATLNYTFSPNVVQKFNLSALKLYVSGENLLTFTSKKGLEAQENFSGTTTNRYSPSKVISLGVNITF